MNWVIDCQAMSNLIGLLFKHEHQPIRRYSWIFFLSFVIFFSLSLHIFIIRCLAEKSHSRTSRITVGNLLLDQKALTLAANHHYCDMHINLFVYLTNLNASIWSLLIILTINSKVIDYVNCGVLVQYVLEVIIIW